MDGDIIIEGTRRRVWPEDVKQQIVEESCAPGMTVCAVARSHDLDPAQVYAWRKMFRERSLSLSSSPAFVPVALEGSAPNSFGDVPRDTVRDGVTSERLEVRLLGGRQLHAPVSIDAERLVDLVRALERV